MTSSTTLESGVQIKNIGPREIAQPAIYISSNNVTATIDTSDVDATVTETSNVDESTNKSGRPFTMASADWLTIQAYVAEALMLPITPETMRKSLGMEASANVDDFKPLIDCYQNIFTHCLTWQNDTFPASVSLAGDIYHYSQKVSFYYDPILPLAQALSNDPNNSQAKAELIAILSNLSDEVKSNRKKATDVFNKIKDFADKTKVDKTTLSGADGNDGLVKKYNDEYGQKSDRVQQIHKDLEAQRIILKAKNDEYQKDVTIAATTPTYAWVPFVGLIAAGAIASYYGYEAVKALDDARAAQKKIDELNKEEAVDVKLMNALTMAEGGMHKISDALNNALPNIERIEGVWGAIAQDLDSIVHIIQNDIAEALPIIMSLGVEEAKAAWAEVGNEANIYRLNAYITVQPS